MHNGGSACALYEFRGFLKGKKKKSSVPVQCVVPERNPTCPALARFQFRGFCFNFKFKSRATRVTHPTTSHSRSRLSPYYALVFSLGRHQSVVGSFGNSAKKGIKCCWSRLRCFPTQLLLLPHGTPSIQQWHRRWCVVCVLNTAFSALKNGRALSTRTPPPTPFFSPLS